MEGRRLLHKRGLLSIVGVKFHHVRDYSTDNLTGSFLNKDFDLSIIS